MTLRNRRTERDRFSSITIAISALLLVLASLGHAELYWAHDAGIDTAGFEGEAQRQAYAVASQSIGASEPNQVTVDADDAKFYWTQSQSGADGITFEYSLWAANLDGTNPQQVLSNSTFINNAITPNLFPFTIDTADNMMLWPVGGSIVSRLPVSGIGVAEQLALVDGTITAMSVDAASHRLYWIVETTTGIKLQRLSLDPPGGSPPVPNPVEDVLTLTDTIPSVMLAVDTGVTGRAYWIGLNDSLHTVIRYADLVVPSQGDLRDLDFTAITSLTLDPNNGKLYWIAEGFDSTVFDYVSMVNRGNLDGSGTVETVVTGLESSWRSSLGIDTTGQRLYWTRSTRDTTTFSISGTLQWANIADGIPQEILFGASSPPVGIVANAAQGKLYWTNPGQRSIQRANLDGTQLESDYITGLSSPEAVTMDMVNQKLYWTTESAIQTATPIVQNVLTGLDSLRGIAVDGDTQTLYWASGEKLQKASLSNPTDTQTDLVTGLASPMGVALDLKSDKLYWADSGAGLIQSCNLDGSNVQTVVSGVSSPKGIAVDTHQGRVYWTTKNRIHSSNLDGSDVQDIGVVSDGNQYLTLTSKGFPLGDVSGDSQVNAYDAALVLQYAVGLIDVFPVEALMGHAPADTSPQHYQVTVATVNAKPGERVSVPVEIDRSSEYLSGAFRLEYDPSVLRATHVYLGLTGAYWQANIERAGEVRVAFVSTRATSDTVPLFVVEFEISGTVPTESVLTLADVELSNSLSVRRQNGYVRVLPGQTRLLPNFPNPFNPETWIPYELTQDADVRLSIFDSQGRLVRTLLEQYQPAGSYATRQAAAYWDGRTQTGESAASGVYFYQLIADDFTAMRKMIIAR